MVAAVVRACLVEISRRRVVIALLMLLPVTFYLLRRDAEGQSIRFLALGLGWTVSTLALFVAVAGKGIDVRLRLAGYAAWKLVLGRATAITACGLVLAGLCAVIIAVDQDVERFGAVAILLVTTTLIAAPLGAVVSAIFPRDLEGILALLAILAAQMLADPAGSAAKFLPFWSTREIGTFAIDGGDNSMLINGFEHFAFTWILLIGLAILVSCVRLRLHRPTLAARAPRIG